jgi:hypothetical protein
MVDLEDKVNGVHSATSPVTGIAQSLAALAGDVVELTELNVRLVREDAKLAGQKALSPAIWLTVGIALLVACLPVLGFGLASCLAEFSGWKLWIAQLLIGAIMGAAAVGICVYALLSIRRAGAQFGRSTKEIANNVAWIKSVIRET